MIRILLLLSLFLPTILNAQYCGKDSGLACPGVDKDGDGYTTDGSFLGYDCDDTNFQIIPGTQRYVSGYYSYCETAGTWSTGTLTPNAATGSGANYFIDCNAATNGTGAFASPWNNLTQVSSLAWGSGQPAGWHNPVLGDAIWIKGQCDDLIDRDGVPGGDKYLFFLLSRDGTSSHKIKILQWPGGAQAHLRNTSEYVSKIVNVEASDYVEFWGIEISGLGDVGLFFSDSEAWLFEIGNIHDVDGDANNNNSGLYVQSSTNGKVQHSVFDDNYDISNVTSYNNRNIALFQGTGNKVRFNLVKYSDAGIIADSSHPRNIGYKHGDTVTTTASTAEISYNVILNSEIGVETGEAGTWVHHNYDDSNLGFTNLEDVGGPFYPRNTLVEYNTTYAKKLFEVDNSSADSTALNNIVRNNVIYSNVSAYNSELGAIVDTVYGDNTLYDSVSNTSAYDYRTNCYYNSGAGTMVFNHFNASGGYGAKGAQYFFAGWQATDTSGTNNKPAWDDDSFYENPILNSISNATSTNCANKGYLAGLTGGGEPIYSPTPTPSASPTSTPIGGRADFNKRTPYNPWSW